MCQEEILFYVSKQGSVFFSGFFRDYDVDQLAKLQGTFKHQGYVNVLVIVIPLFSACCFPLCHIKYGNITYYMIREGNVEYELRI